MFSLFPSLLSFGILAPLMLRLVLGATVIHFAFTHIKKREHVPVIFGIIQAIAGVLLCVGLLTQLAAFVCVIIFGLLIIKKFTQKALFTDGVNYYVILFIIALSLIFSGPGYPAFDLPL